MYSGSTEDSDIAGGTGAEDQNKMHGIRTEVSYAEDTA